MVTERKINIERIKKVALRLDHLREKSVFLGGSAVSLLITDKAASDVRPTIDVDIVVGVKSSFKYTLKLRRELISLGFQESDSLYRWLADDVIVDIMPQIERVLGFSNKWYKHAM